jgi:hypothetical protein
VRLNVFCHRSLTLILSHGGERKITKLLNQESVKKMKEYICIEVKHHKDISKTLEEYQQQGWRLHTYQATATMVGLAAIVSHYLLLEKDAGK